MPRTPTPDAPSAARPRRARRKEARPGELLEAIAGRAAWPHRVYEQYWPMASARSFAPLAAAPGPAAQAGGSVSTKLGRADSLA